MNTICWNCGNLRIESNDRCIECTCYRILKDDEQCTKCKSLNRADAYRCRNCNEYVHWWCRYCRHINHKICRVCVLCNQPNMNNNEAHNTNSTHDTNSTHNTNAIFDLINNILNSAAHRHTINTSSVVVPTHLVIRYSYEDHNDTDYNDVINRSFNENHAPINRKLDTLIKKKLKSNRVSKFDLTNDSCTICLMNYFDSEYITHLPCNHYFHKKCINKHFNNYDNCPICRATIS